MKILGISAFYHDSSACIVKNGEIISAVQEERFTRKKNDKNFPLNSINYCLKQSKIKLSEIDAISSSFSDACWLTTFCSCAALAMCMPES